MTESYKEQGAFQNQDWPPVEYDYKKDGRLVWNELMFDIIDAVNQGRSTEVLPHVPEELFKSMIFDYAGNIDSDWMMDHGPAFVSEFKRRGIPLQDLIDLLPDIDDYQSKFVAKCQIQMTG